MYYRHLINYRKQTIQGNLIQWEPNTLGKFTTHVITYPSNNPPHIGNLIYKLTLTCKQYLLDRIGFCPPEYGIILGNLMFRRR